MEVFILKILTGDPSDVESGVDFAECADDYAKGVYHKIIKSSSKIGSTDGRRERDIRGVGGEKEIISGGRREYGFE